MRSEDYAVVFKMKDRKNGKLYAIKCFLIGIEEHEDNYKKISEVLNKVRSPYFSKIAYLPNELHVESYNCYETEFPVVKMNWIEGVTLDNYIESHLNNSYALSMLSWKFCCMASWLLPQPFAHGNLKPDNILVKTDGTLKIVDYDGMFVPSMRGQKAYGYESSNYQHPLRTEDDFNERIDDFALTSIALSLKAFSLDSSLFRYADEGHLLFDESDYRDLSSSEIFGALQALMIDSEFIRLYSLFMQVYSEKTLSAESFPLFNLPQPCPFEDTYINPEDLTTRSMDRDLEYSIEDEFGGVYSKDGKKLLKYSDMSLHAEIMEGTCVICNDAFIFNSRLECVKIPSSVIEIGDRAFCCCHSLETVVIPKSVKFIGDDAFSSCESLKKVVFPDSVVSIGKDAFRGCRSLKKIVLSGAVTNIGDGAFAYCESLQSVIMPDSVKNIGDRIFVGCTSLRNVVFPDSVENIGINPFEECNISDFKCRCGNDSFDGNALYGKGGKLLIAFINKNITHFEIPTTVTSIGEEAFTGCDSLQSIVIPESVTSVGDRAFGWCISLEKVVFPDSIEKIGINPFVVCEISDFKFSPKHFSYDGYALYNKERDLLISLLKTDITHFEIPNTVTTIGSEAFSYCQKLQTVVIPQSVTNIDDWAFNCCKSLQNVVIPDSVTTIGANTFNSCESLQSVFIPNSVTTIGANTFESCINLQTVVISNSVTNIDNEVFSNCLSLQSVAIPDSVISIGERAFNKCESLQNVTIPNSVTSIEEDAFSECESLKAVVIPDSVNKIGYGVFSLCYTLKTVVIPKSVKSIGNGVFSYCDSLEKILIPKGTKRKFAKLLADYKELLVEYNKLTVKRSNPQI